VLAGGPEGVGPPGGGGGGEGCPPGGAAGMVAWAEAIAAPGVAGAGVRVAANGETAGDAPPVSPVGLADGVTVSEAVALAGPVGLMEGVTAGVAGVTDGGVVGERVARTVGLAVCSRPWGCAGFVVANGQAALAVAAGRVGVATREAGVWVGDRLGEAAAWGWVDTGAAGLAAGVYPVCVGAGRVGPAAVAVAAGGAAVGETGAAKVVVTGGPATTVAGVGLTSRPG